MLYCNTNGIFNKISELQVVADLYHADLICVTETHLYKEILDAEISLPGFQKPFRKDRDFNVLGTGTESSNRGGWVGYLR